MHDSCTIDWSRDGYGRVREVSKRAGRTLCECGHYVLPDPLKVEARVRTPLGLPAKGQVRGLFLTFCHLSLKPTKPGLPTEFQKRRPRSGKEAARPAWRVSAAAPDGASRALGATSTRRPAPRQPRRGSPSLRGLIWVADVHPNRALAVCNGLPACLAPPFDLFRLFET